jgi:hypothetical protein
MTTTLTRRSLFILPALPALAQVPFALCPAAAQEVGVGVEVGIAPPPLRVETVPPPPSPAHEWVPGHWQWNGAQWVWRPGHYLRRPTPVSYWVPAAWVPTPSGRYRYVPGHWARR